jgi:hypothetical protein
MQVVELPTCDQICVGLDKIDASLLFSKIAITKTAPPLRRILAEESIRMENTKALTKVAKLNAQVEKTVAKASGESPTKKHKKEKTGVLYDWFDEWNGHGKNGNIGLVPEPFRSVKSLTWEKFLETPEGKTAEHFEAFVNALYE